MADHRVQNAAGEYRQWRFHWVRSVEWRSDGVVVEAGSRFSRRPDRVEVPYGALAMTNSRVRSGASVWWLVFGVWAGVWGPALWLIDRGDYGVGDVLVLVAVGTAAMLYWWARRVRWIGFGPVYLWDRGDKTEAALDEIHRARCRALVERDARADVSYTLDMVNQWLRAQYIDATFAEELRAMAKQVGYWPEGYL